MKLPPQKTTIFWKNHSVNGVNQVYDHDRPCARAGGSERHLGNRWQPICLARPDGVSCRCSFAACCGTGPQACWPGGCTCNSPAKTWLWNRHRTSRPFPVGFSTVHALWTMYRSMCIVLGSGCVWCLVTIIGLVRFILLEVGRPGCVCEDPWTSISTISRRCGVLTGYLVLGVCCMDLFLVILNLSTLCRVSACMHACNIKVGCSSHWTPFQLPGPK